MRIHTIELENLASLYGPHTVDLDRELGGAGLFLIHGPMGAGKTTLLDAICVALFGLTPRLNDSGGRQKTKLDGLDLDDPAHLMSRGTGKCRATVEISLADAAGELQRYRATWSLKRAREKATGEFQPPKRRLERLLPDGQWETLVDSNTRKDFSPYFAEMLRGLTFDDFQRTILLAQFAFQQFLQASSEERAKLLERMTDSQQFKLLGQRAAARMTEATSTLKTLEAQREGRAMLSPEDEQRLIAAVAAGEGQLRDVQTERARLDDLRRFWIELGERTRAMAAADERLAEADAALTASADVRDILARDRAVRPAADALRTLRTARAETAKAATERETAAGLFEAARTTDQSHQAAKAAAAEGRRLAEATLAESIPRLDAADIAWRALGDARRVYAELKNKAAAREATARVKRARVLTVMAHAQGCEVALAEKTAALQGIPHAEALQRDLSGLLAQGVSLEKLRGEATRQGQEADAAEAELERRQRELGKLESETPRLQGAVETTRIKAEQAADTLRAAGGAEPLKARDTTRDAEVSATAQLAALQTIESLDTKLANTLLARTQAEADAIRHRADAAADEATATQALERGRLATALLESVERELKHLDRQLSVSDRRSALAENEACPLCGSLDHPYRRDPAAAPSTETLRAERTQAESRKTEAAAQAKRDETEATQAALHAAQMKSEAEADERRARDLSAQWVELAAGRAETAKQTGLAEGEAISGRRGALQQAVAAARQRLAAIDAAMEADKHAVDDAQKAADRLAKHTAERSSVQQAVAHQMELRDGALGRVTETVQGLMAAEAALRLALAKLGLGTPDVAPDLTVALRQGQRRFDQIVTLKGEVETLKGNAAETQLALEKAKSAAEADEREVEAARQDQAKGEAYGRQAAATSREHFDGADPGPIRKGLGDAALQARDADEACLRTLAEAAAALSGATGALRERTERLTRQTEETGTRLAEFEATRLAAGAADEADVDARTLDDTRRQALETQVRALQDRQTQARAIRDEATGRLDGHRAKAPEGEAVESDETGDARAAELAGEIATHDERLNGLQREIAVDTQRLAANEALKQGAAELEADIDAARAERDLWKSVNDVIGTNDGQAFVTIVQALNLRAVLVRANLRLERFLPRYRLEQIVSPEGEPKLDFCLIDAHQQGAKRPTRSLSGGESFIVSLALALGLADMRSSRLRIETLLIDEGFGSVDLLTLREVLSALEALRATTGTRIGLISHAELLKEAIPAQVAVIPNGDGRSSRLAFSDGRVG